MRIQIFTTGSCRASELGAANEKDAGGWEAMGISGKWLLLSVNVQITVVSSLVNQAEDYLTERDVAALLVPNYVWLINCELIEPIQVKDGRVKSMSPKEAGFAVKSGEYTFLDVRPSNERAKVLFVFSDCLGLNVSMSVVFQIWGSWEHLLSDAVRTLSEIVCRYSIDTRLSHSFLPMWAIRVLAILHNSLIFTYCIGTATVLRLLILMFGLHNFPPCRPQWKTQLGFLCMTWTSMVILELYTRKFRT